jgi:hypothetical protein
VIRVKEDKISTYVTKNSSFTTEDITYRWYASYNRYPVLVLIKSSGSACGGGTTRAAYNSNVPSQGSASSGTGGSINSSENGSNINVFPNPADNIVNISFLLTQTSNVNITVVDASGQFISQVVVGSYPAGEQNITFNAKELLLMHGLYFIKISINGNESVESIEIQ